MGRAVDLALDEKHLHRKEPQPAPCRAWRWAAPGRGPAAAREEGSAPEKPEVPQRPRAGAQQTAAGQGRSTQGRKGRKPEDLIPGLVVILKLQKVPVLTYWNIFCHQRVSRKGASHLPLVAGPRKRATCYGKRWSVSQNVCHHFCVKVHRPPTHSSLWILGFFFKQTWKRLSIYSLITQAYSFSLCTVQWIFSVHFYLFFSSCSSTLESVKYRMNFLINCQEHFTNKRFSKYFHLITGFAFSNLTTREPRYTKMRSYLPV